MPQAAPAELPASFFEEAAAPADAAGLAPDVNLPPAPVGQWQPTKMMYWYDSIIDDFLAHPGTSVRECAARLGRNPVTISLIARSDLFKARYAQRRKAFNEDLDSRLTGKLAKIAEKSLDLTLEVLEKKQTAVPLPQLVEIQNKALDRLGYGTQASSGGAVNVNVVNGVALTATPEALAEARRKLRLLEDSKLGVGPVAAPASLGGGSSPLLEAQDLGKESEGAS